MSNVVISAEQVSKFYRLGLIGGKTLRDDLERWWARRRGKPDPLLKIGQADHGNRNGEYVWALKDVSFEVKEGEVLGIIGRNGAGKSTLLKILSRVTAPTSGEIRVKGRVASLLEVGTGFHPELTGRENIFLNGAILGMTKAEVRSKFDEIVDFSGIEKFIDTPVKRYSSGMYVRLAFAVAAHLDPEILLVDEVLAVGDAEFQKKCLGKMGDVAKEGRTVLFVSHNMGAIETLCQSVIVIRDGKTSFKGNTKDGISDYLRKNFDITNNPFDICTRRGNGKLRITSFHFETEDGKRVEFVQSGGSISMTFGFRNYGCSPTDKVNFSFSIHNDCEVRLLHYYSDFSEKYFSNIPSNGYIKCLITDFPLSPGNYILQCRVVMNGNYKTGEEVDWPQVFVPIRAEPGDFFHTGRTDLSTWGPFLMRGVWHMTNR